MEALPNNPILNFKPGTLDVIRKQYGLDRPERINEAIEILVEWLKKQEHFVIKEFPKEYLERIIINNKGLIEKCKKKLDKICTMRTLLPEFFGSFDVNDCKDAEDIFTFSILPNMTEDFCRVVFINVTAKKYSSDLTSQILKMFLLVADYLMSYDYSNGVIIIEDWRRTNVLDFITCVDLVELRRTADIIFEGYSMRLKGLHFITASKTLETLVSLIRQMVSPKLRERINGHRTIDSISDLVPMELLPMDYGGKEKEYSELNADLMRELNSIEFKEHRKQMNTARTNEMYRRKDNFNDAHMGTSGTFRNLTLD